MYNGSFIPRSVGLRLKYALDQNTIWGELDTDSNNKNLMRAKE